MKIEIDPVFVDPEKVNRRNRAFIVHHFLNTGIENAIEKYARGNVLDIGCGYKPYEKFFKKNPSITKYTGCDIRQTKMQTVDIVCDATHIPLENAAFQTIFCTQVIEHSHEYPEILGESYRLLSKDGILILSAPMYWPLHGEPHDFFRFTKFGLENILARSGFEMIEIRANGGSWAVAGQALIHAADLSQKRSFLFRAIRFLFFRAGFLQLMNRLFVWMDKKDYCETNTMNYVVIGKKSSKEE